MASNFKIKRSAVPGKKPQISDLELGELAVNFYDGKVFFKQDQGAVGVGTRIAEVGAAVSTFENNVSVAGTYGASQVPLNQYLGQLAFLDDYHPNGLRRDGGGSDDVVVGDDGTVGIGTDSIGVTGYALEVRGNVYLNNGGNGTDTLYLNDGGITGVNNLTFNDPGPGEGIIWGNGNGWEIYESPNNLTTNSAGNLQFVVADSRVLTLDTEGNAEFTGSVNIGNISGNTTFQDEITFQSDAYFGDNVVLNFGTDNDLQIYHDGNNSYINQTPSSTGDLFLIGSGRLVLQTHSPFDSIAENSIVCNEDGAVELYYNNTKKFETTDLGVKIGSVININSYDDLYNGTLSFNGTYGPLFTISNDSESGLFNISDISGIPSFNIDQYGTIQLAPYVSTEYVGIGTTNPQAKLDVNGSLNVSGISTFVGFTTFNNNVSVAGTITELYNGSYWNIVTQADVGYGASQVVGYGASQVPLNQYLGQLAFLDDYHPNGLRRDGGGSDDVFVKSDGFVGIGTTNPTANLDVHGTLNVTGVSTFVGVGTFLGDLYVGGDLYVADDIVFDELTARNININGIGTIPILDTTTGTIDYLSGTNISYSGIGTIETLDTTTGTVDYLSGTNISYSGIGTIETLDTTTGTVDYLSNTNINTSGIGTITSLSGNTLTYNNINAVNGYINVGIITTLSGTNLNYSGIGTITTVDIVNATIDNLTFTSGTAITSVDTDLTTVSGSDDTLASAKAIKAYVDAQNTAQDLDIQGDTGGLLSIDLDDENLTIAGTANEIETVGSGNTITIGLPNQVAITTSLVVGSGVTITGSTVQVGGTITELYNGQYWNVVTQADVGYGASQVPLNQYLGQLAFLDDHHPNGLRRDGGGYDDVFVKSDGFVGIGTDAPSEKLDVAGNIAINQTTVVGSATASLSTLTETVIHTGLSAFTYRSVEYNIQATQGTNFHVTKILALHNGTTAYHNEYGTIFNNTSVATFNVDVSGGNIRLLATGASASQTDYVVNFTATKI
jgi:hypothetical protein